MCVYIYKLNGTLYSKENMILNATAWLDIT